MTDFFFFLSANPGTNLLLFFSPLPNPTPLNSSDLGLDGYERACPTTWPRHMVAWQRSKGCVSKNICAEVAQSVGVERGGWVFELTWDHALEFVREREPPRYKYINTVYVNVADLRWTCILCITAAELLAVGCNTVLSICQYCVVSHR